MKHGEIEANGISLHFVEEGHGPAVAWARLRDIRGVFSEPKWP